MVKHKLKNIKWGMPVALFPGSTQLSRFSILQAAESWAGPGNKASNNQTLHTNLNTANSYLLVLILRR